MLPAWDDVDGVGAMAGDGVPVGGVELAEGAMLLAWFDEGGVAAGAVAPDDDDDPGQHAARPELQPPPYWAPDESGVHAVSVQQ